MRISDWSSDVCSSDLHQRLALLGRQLRQRPAEVLQFQGGDLVRLAAQGGGVAAVGVLHLAPPLAQLGVGEVAQDEIGRASCRERCVRTCRYRWSPDHKKRSTFKAKSTQSESLTT